MRYNTCINNKQGTEQKCTIAVLYVLRKALRKMHYNIFISNK